jgi:flavin-dependent dehydrogenase
MSAAFDLLVAGGGPAGAALASLAADAGLRVLVVERKRFPRGKVCGEFVSAEGCRVLERLGVKAALVAAGGREIRACTVTAGGSARIEARLPDLGDGSGSGLGVSRELLDSVLLDRARRAGAVVLERHAVLPHDTGGTAVTAMLQRVAASEPASPVRARVIVAADGRSSAFARRRRRTGVTRDRSWFGLETHLDGAPAGLDATVELHAFDGGYVGLCSIEGQRTNVCLLVQVRALRTAGGDPARLFAERVAIEPSVRRVLPRATTRSTWRAVGRLTWGAAHPAARGVLFVGDAAGTIDPLCGEGMSHALRGAEIALPFVVRAAARGGVDLEIEREYRAAWRREFARATRRARALGFVLERRPVARLLLGTIARRGSLAESVVAWSRTGHRGERIRI